MAAPAEKFIEGTVKSVRRWDSGYTVVKIQPRRGPLETLTGDVSHLSEGMVVKAHVESVDHPKYGTQYKVIEVHESGFATTEGLAKYLASSTFKGIGTATAKAIVAYLADTVEDDPDAILDAIDNNPDILFKVPNINHKAAADLVGCWHSVREVEKNLGELMGLGLGRKLALKVNKHFGGNGFKIVSGNYYKLTDVPGIGFITADEIALKHGVKRDSVDRAAAATFYVLDQSKMNGHCYLLMSQLASDTAEKLLKGDINLFKVSDAIKLLASQGEVIVEKDRVYLTSVYYAEQEVAKKIKAFINYKSEQFIADLNELNTLLQPIEDARGIAFAPEQKDALFTILNSRVCVITGGPGTGKSTLTYAAIKLLEEFGISYKLCSPTGMASKRLANATEEEASTIHRLLIFREGEFVHNASNPLWTDCVLVDETSMVDISLCRSLLSAIETSSRVILIGDADQLPSVGAGNVLRDIIASGAVPVVRLQTIFRQAAGSAITVAAHDILHGRVPNMPSPRQSKGNNCMFIGAEEPSVLIDYVLKMVGESLPKSGLGIGPDDIQVLTPMRGRGLGVDDLNPKLQALLNPANPEKAEIVDNFLTFRVGDRVMQTRNDYNKNVFNGYVGKIASISRHEDTAALFVKYPDMESPVEYSSEEWDDLQLAYASTIHKSQGSEYPAVILLMHPSHRNMLQRNLFYTGLTRAKKICIVAGTMGAVEQAVNNSKEAHRNTTLKQLLMK